MDAHRIVFLVAWTVLYQRSMKTFLVVVVVVTALYLWQRRGQETVPPAPAPIAAQSPPAVLARPVSEHNWAKHSLDRAHEVADQVRQTREQNDER